MAVNHKIYPDSVEEDVQVGLSLVSGLGVRPPLSDRRGQDPAGMQACEVNKAYNEDSEYSPLIIMKF